MQNRDEEPEMLTPWAAPKKGFSGFDWATPSWVRALKCVGSPGHDFILKGVSANGTKLFERVAMSETC